MPPRDVLLVEGADDKHVVWSLLQLHSVPETFQVSDKGGYTKVLEVLPVQLKGSDVKSVGIVLDADLNLASRWDSVRSATAKAGYAAVPKVPNPNGTIVTQAGLPRFGAWLMPNNSLPGMLEDFIKYLVPATDALYPIARTAVTAIPVATRKFKPDHLSKAEIHTWLAWQEDPGTPLGLAITKSYLLANAAQAVLFVDWMKALFG